MNPDGLKAQAATSAAALAFGMRLTPIESSEPPVRTPATELTSVATQPPVTGTGAIVTNRTASAVSPPPENQGDPAPSNAQQAHTNSLDANLPDSGQADTNQADGSVTVGSRAVTIEVKSRQDPSARNEATTPAVAAIATGAGGSNDPAGEFAGDFTRQFPGSVSTLIEPQAAGRVRTAPAPSAAEALVTSEPAASAARAQSLAPAQQISVRIAPPQAPVVDLHMMERGGQVHVAVRTADGVLQTWLRQDLGSLVSSLERSGFRTETFTPHEIIQHVPAGPQMNSPNGRHESESGSGGRGGNSGDAGKNPSQNFGGGQRHPRPRDQRSQKWNEELENLT